MNLEFDIYRKSDDIRGMTKTLEELTKAIEKYEYKGVLYTRMAILDLYNGKSHSAVKLFLREHGFTEKAIENVLRKAPTRR